MREVGAERSHAGAAAEVNHLALRRLDVERAVRRDGGDGVARPQIEHVAGSDARSAILSRRGRRYPNVEAQRAIELIIAGKGVVVATTARGVGHRQVEEM